MLILVSNDDGISSQGIEALTEQLSTIAEVIVVAPDRDRSGASNSLTLDQPIRANEIRPNRFRVNGTPTDCVHLALTGFLDKEPDMVISGINHGANMGDDVLYSGTVAAAMEGRFLGHSAIAMSLVYTEKPHFFVTAAVVAVTLAKRLIKYPLPNDTILNVNVPDIALEELKGYQATRLGYRHRAEPFMKQMDPRGNPVYWIGPAGKEQDAGPGTDFHAVKNNYVSITPIMTDLTKYKALDQVSNWLVNQDNEMIQSD